MIPDQHTHTVHSPDAKEDATIARYVEALKKTDLPSVSLTDHVDLDSPVELFKQLPDYSALFSAVKHANTASKKTINVGVEMGYQPHIVTKMNDYVRAHPFDVVIMSVHVGDGLDFHNGDFFGYYGQKHGLKRYFEIVNEALDSGADFDIFGHIDYINRYVPGNVKDYNFDAFKPQIDAALTRIIAMDKAIEINTSGMRYGLDDHHPKHPLLKRYYALGGRKITLGSDAHTPDDIGHDFTRVTEQLKSIGFEYICHYTRRQCEFVRI